MDKFNLKQFINENNLGAYSRLNEDVDYHIELLVPKVAFDVESGDLADSPYEFGTEDEIEDGDVDVTTYTDGDELDEFVFDRSYKQAKHFEKTYPGLFKVVTKVSEKKGKDHDGDGDIDSDDYMAAKDAAIKKATGKNEEVEEDRFVASSMEDLEQVIRNLAHTANISEDEALEMAIKKLENMLDSRDDLDEDAEEDAKNDADDAAGWIDDPRMDEDLDVGHQDDEPNMLKKKMYRAAKMAAMLYKELDKFDSLPNEVDFPNWWQAKLIKANDYLNSAFDYLDAEQQTAKLDKVVTHENYVSEKKVEVDDDTDFKVKLSHLLDKHVDN